MLSFAATDVGHFAVRTTAQLLSRHGHSVVLPLSERCSFGWHILSTLNLSIRKRDPAETPSARGPTPRHIQVPPEGLQPRASDNSSVFFLRDAGRIWFNMTATMIRVPVMTLVRDRRRDRRKCGVAN